MSEQPNPKPNDQPEVWPAVIAELQSMSSEDEDWGAQEYGAVPMAAVIADMRARDRLGRERYGVPLQPFNGRDAMRDLYEELLDACAYAMQLHMESPERGRLVTVPHIASLAALIRGEMHARDDSKGGGR